MIQIQSDYQQGSPSGLLIMTVECSDLLPEMHHIIN